MRSTTRLRAGPDADGTTHARELRAEAPQLLRVTDRGGPGRPLTVHLVGGAAGPLGGDYSTFELELEPATRVEVRGVAATLVHPGAVGGRSQAAVDVTLGADAHLVWWPEPLIAIAGCDHRLLTTIHLAAGARLQWVDEVVCGRTDEPGGTVHLRQRIVLDGRPVADHDLVVGPAASGPGWHGDRRVLVTAVEIGGLADPAARPPILEGAVRAARLTPEPGVTLWVAVGDALESVRAALATLGLRR